MPTILDTRFLDPVTPSGALASRFDWGRVQGGNGELAPYVDKTTEPWCDPHPIINGERRLRAQMMPVREGGKTYRYSASMLTTQHRAPFLYGFFELDITINPEFGVTPAFWFMPASGARFPEVDIFEYFNGQECRSNVHTAQGQASHVLPVSQEPGRHIWGVNWTRKVLQIRCDGELIDERPNPSTAPMYLILNNAVGLLTNGEEPRWIDNGWHNDIILHRLRVWDKTGVDI